MSSSHLSPSQPRRPARRRACTPSAAAPAQMAAASLCTRCALCCNGVLFADVQLQPGDNPARLRAFGLPLASQEGVTRFPQPCAGLEGYLCRLYADRPDRCRRFDCRLLQRVQAGTIRLEDARQIIRDTRRHADTIRRLVRRLGQTDETLPLSLRYRQVMEMPLDLSADRRQEQWRGQLLLAVYELTQSLEKNFLV